MKALMAKGKKTLREKLLGKYETAHSSTADKMVGQLLGGRTGSLIQFLY